MGQRVLGRFAWLPLLLAAFGAHAQLPGSGPVRVVVVGAPGGPSDSTIRLLVPKLSTAFGNTVVVENRPGTLGQAAVDLIKGASRDGRTLMLGNSGTHTVAPALYRNVRY